MSGATFIYPFDNEKVISEQGTIGLEISDQLKSVHDVFVPVGVGGILPILAIAI